jgi:hypothetical protein
MEPFHSRLANWVGGINFVPTWLAVMAFLSVIQRGFKVVGGFNDFVLIVLGCLGFILMCIFLITYNTKISWFPVYAVIILPFMTIFYVIGIYRLISELNPVNTALNNLVFFGALPGFLLLVALNVWLFIKLVKHFKH